MRYLKIVAISIAILLGFAGIAIGIAAIGGKFNQKPIQLTEIYFSVDGEADGDSSKALHKYAVIEESTSFVVNYLPSNATNRVINVTVAGGNKSIFENVPSAITGGTSFTLTPAKFKDGYNKTGSILLKFENPYCSTECYLHVAVDQTVSNTKVGEDGKIIDCFDINTTTDENGNETIGLVKQDNSTLGPTYLMNSSSMMKDEYDSNKGGRILWVKSNFSNAVDPDTGTAFPAQGEDGGISTLYNPILFSLVSRNDGVEERIEADDIKLTQTYDEATRSYMLRLTAENRQTKQFYLKMQMHRSNKLKTEFENSGFNDFKSKFNDSLNLENNQEYKNLCVKFKNFVNKYYSGYFKASDENNNNFIKNEIIDSSSDSFTLNTIIKAFDIIMVTQYQSFRIIDISVNSFMFNTVIKEWEFDVFENENTTIDDISGLSSTALTSRYNLNFDIAGESSDLTDEQFKSEIKLLKSNVKITPVVWDSKITDSKLTIANLISQNTNAEFVYQNDALNNNESNPFKVVNAGKTEYKTGFVDGSNFIKVVRDGSRVEFIPNLPSKLYSKEENSFKIYLVFSIETVDKDGNNIVFYNYIDVSINRDNITGNLKVKEPKEMIVNSEYLNNNEYAGKTQSLEYSIESELRQYKTVKIFADESSIKIGTDLSKINADGKNIAKLFKYANFDEDEEIVYKNASGDNIKLIELGTITYLDNNSQVGVMIEAICAQFDSPVKLYAVLILTDKDGNPIDRDGNLLYQTIDGNGKIKVIDNNGNIEYKDGNANTYYDFTGKELTEVQYYALAWSTEPTDLAISSVVDNIYFYTYIEKIEDNNENSYSALYLNKKTNTVEKVEGGKFFLRNNRYNEIDGSFTNLKLISGEDYAGTLIFTFNPLAVNKIDGLAEASTYTVDSDKFSLNFDYGLVGSDDSTKRLNTIYQNNHIEAIKKLLTLVGQNASGGYDLLDVSMFENGAPLSEIETSELLNIISVEAIKNDTNGPIVGFKIQIKSNSDFGVSPTAQIKISDEFIDIYRNIISQEKVLDKFNIMGVTSATYGISGISKFAEKIVFLNDNPNEDENEKSCLEIHGEFGDGKFDDENKFVPNDLFYNKHCYNQNFVIGSSANTIINESDLNISNYSYITSKLTRYFELKAKAELNSEEERELEELNSSYFNDLLNKHKYNIIDPSVNFQNSELNSFYNKLKDDLKSNNSPLQLTLYAYGENIGDDLEEMFESDAYEWINPSENKNTELLKKLKKNVYDKDKTEKNVNNISFYKLTLTTDKKFKINKNYVASGEKLKLAVVYDFDLTRTFENPASSFIELTQVEFTFKELIYYFRKGATLEAIGFIDGVKEITLPKTESDDKGDPIEILVVEEINFSGVEFGDGCFTYRKISGSENIKLKLRPDYVEGEVSYVTFIYLEIPSFSTEGGKPLVYEIVFNFADGGGAKKIIFTIEIQPKGSYSLNKNYFDGATEESPNSNLNNWLGFDAVNKLVLLDGGFGSSGGDIINKNTSTVSFGEDKITYNFNTGGGFYSAESDTIVYKIKDNSLNTNLSDKIKIIGDDVFGTGLEVRKLLTDAEFILEVYKRTGDAGSYVYDKKTEVNVKVVAKDKIVLENLTLTTGENGDYSYYIANKAFKSGDSVVDGCIKLSTYSYNGLMWSQVTKVIDDYSNFVENIKVFGEISDKGKTELYDETGSLEKNKYMINGESVYDLYFNRNNTTNVSKNIFNKAEMKVDSDLYEISYKNLETELVAPIRISFNGLTQYGDSIEVLIPLLTYKLGVDISGSGDNYAYDSNRDNLVIDGVDTVAAYDNSISKYTIKLNTMGAGNNALGNFFNFKIMQLFSDYESQYGTENISVVPTFNSDELPTGVSLINNDLIVGDGFDGTINLNAKLDYYVLSGGSAVKMFSISGVKIELTIIKVPMRLYYNNKNEFGNELSFSSQILTYTTNETATQLIPVISILNLPKNNNLGNIFKYKKGSTSVEESFSSFKVKEIRLTNGSVINEETNPSVDKIENYVTVGNATMFKLTIANGKDDEIAELTIEAISSDGNVYHINYVSRINKDVNLIKSETAIDLSTIVSCSNYEICSITLFNDKVYNYSGESNIIDEYLNIFNSYLTCLKDGVEKVVVKASEGDNIVYIDLFAKEIKIVNDLSTNVSGANLNKLADNIETNLTYEINSVYMFDNTTIGGECLANYATISDDLKLTILKQGIQTLTIKMKKYNRENPISITIDAPYLEDVKYADLSKSDNINLNSITGLTGATFKIKSESNYFSVNNDTLSSTSDNQSEVELVSYESGVVRYVRIINNTTHYSSSLSINDSCDLSLCKPSGVNGTISNINILKMWVADVEKTSNFSAYAEIVGSNIKIVGEDVDYIVITFKVDGVDCYVNFYNFNSNEPADLSKDKTIDLNGYVVSGLTYYTSNITSNFDQYISSDGKILKDGVVKINLTKNIGGRTCKRIISTTMIEYYVESFNGAVDVPQEISTISLSGYSISEIKDGENNVVLSDNYDNYAKIEGVKLKCYSSNISSITLTRLSGTTTYTIKVKVR